MYAIFQGKKINDNLRLQTNFSRNSVNANKFVLISLRCFVQNYGIWFHYKLKILRVLKYFKQKFEIGSRKLVIVTYLKFIYII